METEESKETDRQAEFSKMWLPLTWRKKETLPMKLSTRSDKIGEEKHTKVWRRRKRKTKDRQVADKDMTYNVRWGGRERQTAGLKSQKKVETVDERWQEEQSVLRGREYEGVVKHYTAVWQSVVVCLIQSGCCNATVSSFHCLSIFPLTAIIQIKLIRTVELSTWDT